MLRCLAQYSTKTSNRGNNKHDPPNYINPDGNARTGSNPNNCTHSYGANYQRSMKHPHVEERLNCLASEAPSELRHECLVH